MKMEARSWALTLTKEDILRLIHEKTGPAFPYDIIVTDINLSGDGVVMTLESSE
jgi:hypothetical protein